MSLAERIFDWLKDVPVPEKHMRILIHNVGLLAGVFSKDKKRHGAEAEAGTYENVADAMANMVRDLEAAAPFQMLSVLISGHTDDRTRLIRHRSFVDALCDCFKSTPGFDRERFVAACNPTTDDSY